LNKSLQPLPVNTQNDPISALLSSSSTISPEPIYTLSPPPNIKGEISLNQALKHPNASALIPAIAEEIDGMREDYHAYDVIDENEIPIDAIRCHTVIFCKEKEHPNTKQIYWKARMAICGNEQPPHSYLETFAGTADNSLRLLTLALCLADAVFHKYIDRLQINSIDVPKAFVQIPVTSENCPHPIVAKLPNNLPHRLAGRWIILNALVYGTKQANHAFTKEFDRVIKSAGFNPTLGDPHIYTCFHPSDRTKYAILSTHVDDGFIIESYSPYSQKLVSAIENRFGICTKSFPCTIFIGQTIKRHPSGAVTLSMGKAIRKLIHNCSLTNDIPLASTPSASDLFQPSSDLSPYSQALYQRMIGGSIYLLPIRHDIRKEVIFCSTKCSNPTIGDVSKICHYLRYLNATKDLGPTYYTTEGPRIYATCDAADGTHFATGRSQGSYNISVGEHSASVFSWTGDIGSCIPTSSFEAEYVMFSMLSKKIVEFCEFAAEIHFPQLLPVRIGEDNLSTLHLLVAPEITRRSRHIGTRFHHVRDLISREIIEGVKIDSKANPSDIGCKPLGPKAYILKRNILFNTISNPDYNFNQEMMASN
jgi:hypothetical protein